ncbi:hypothetical protein EHI8A_050190 [Entamoeba histolytica HM-1:IMSS-B]|uniref:Uncharacterized protein n=6 Tax=Entamoeba histolytica TaxID=5759 RepID=C4M6M4_ENTH1|nr:hypothetical protein EHI_147480 [Entamoeba histolytica HM-1:IMSS]EMD47347.1 Hypothetical protein EHI5A_030880 [Entamoeba histolytica KU27]EMH76824.1 hypothetical protein EHI8A_050190 [Entamoeba histolytica HM-1:IMSS-B]EMS10971.1 hypothetical protein KM1_037250 [Entamoeba histolytica HM-3:IMSS]ENY61221.1 hypothetical protein EHI7A_014840 [Entamoeba histolytica HM-1:IMSS-A]GAT97138.1 hypothetical protein CL6EHI_147480 [Entamoeba histolytica]|eukprot:XP_654530.1 hypothetical protein EHI_147480 [Entamoeba histolytica HM-1:IMSS]
MEGRKVSKEIVEFCNLIVGTWKLNERTFNYQKGFPEKEAKNVIIDIVNVEVLTNDYRRFYRWTTTDDPETVNKQNYPTMVMEVFGKNEGDDSDFEFRSDDYSEVGIGKINGKWMTIILECIKKDERITKTLYYKLEDKNTMLYTSICVNNYGKDSFIEQGVLNRIYLDDNTDLLKPK